MIELFDSHAHVDGPEFDAHKVDFSVLVQRNAMYREAEQHSMTEYQRSKCINTVTAAGLQGDHR